MAYTVEPDYRIVKCINPTNPFIIARFPQAVFTITIAITFSIVRVKYMCRNSPPDCFSTASFSVHYSRVQL